jgi:hypothetical protein
VQKQRHSVNLVHRVQYESIQRGSPEQKHPEQKHFRTGSGVNVLVRRLVYPPCFAAGWRSAPPSRPTEQSFGTQNALFIFAPVRKNLCLFSCSMKGATENYIGIILTQRLDPIRRPIAQFAQSRMRKRLFVRRSSKHNLDWQWNTLQGRDVKER